MCMMKEMDIDNQQMEADIHEIDYVKEKQDEPTKYNYDNGHGVHLLYLPMTHMSDGNVVPNMEKYMNELLEELSKVDKEKVVDMLQDYMILN